jgi:hypothetical protein
MPLFDTYMMVDWSGSDRRRGDKQDCIWIAHGSANWAEPVTVSPPSRTEAERMIRAELQLVVTANKGRVLVCADFGYGYPAGFASLLPNSGSAEVPPWRIVWQYLRGHIQDDIGTKPANNRTTAAIASTSLTISTPNYRVQLRAARSGVSSSPVIIFAFHNISRGNRSSPVPPPSPRFGSLTAERKAILRSVYSARAASAANSLPAFRASKISVSIRSSPHARRFGLSKPDGPHRLEPGSIQRSESCTRKFIRASERRSRTRSRIAARCARCGTGRAIST